MLAAVIVLIAVFAGNSEAPQEEFEWGDGITEGIPEFAQEYKACAGNESHRAFYYENVSVAQVEEYTALIEAECNIQFSSDKYPRFAKHGDVSVVIHYNVTEMKMSVTLTNTESIQSGEQQ